MSMVTRSYSNRRKRFFQSSVSGDLDIVVKKATVGEISSYECFVRKRHFAVKCWKMVACFGEGWVAESSPLKICSSAGVPVVFFESSCCRKRATISVTYGIIVTTASPLVEKSKVMPRYSCIFPRASFVRPKLSLNTHS